MSVLELLRQESGPELRVLLVVANIAAISYAFMLAIISEAAHAPQDVGFRAVLMFLLLVLMFVVCTRHLNHRVAILVESALHRIKTRVARTLVETDLEALERVRAGEICDRITENMTLISDRARVFATILQSGLIAVALAVYIAYLSITAIVIVSFIVAIGLALFFTMRREFLFAVRKTSRLRVEFFERLADLLRGFKQLKFSRRASRELHADLIETSEAVRETSVRSSSILADNVMLSSAIVFAMFAGVAFVLGAYDDVDRVTLTSLVLATIFLRGPVFSLSVGLMPLVRANFALAVILRLEAKLTAASTTDPDDARDPWPGPPATLQARALAYRYPTVDGEPGFAVGPFDLHFRAGEVCFIVGGNGSGKSTLFKLLAGLYTPSGGQLVLDGAPIDSQSRTAYRERVAAIFTDFHLFDRLYGLDVPEERVKALLSRMRLDHVLRYRDGAFSRLELSTGQRKRLALVVALLEDRPIYLFDEWAADQDPQFRRAFYDELLPELRAAGKIVIAISHDDRYFDRADQLLTMELGRLRAPTGGATP